MYPQTVVAYNDYAYIRKNVVVEERKYENSDDVVNFYVYDECLTTPNAAIEWLNEQNSALVKKSAELSDYIDNILTDVIPTIVDEITNVTEE